MPKKKKRIVDVIKELDAMFVTGYQEYLKCYEQCLFYDDKESSAENIEAVAKLLHDTQTNFHEILPLLNYIIQSNERAIRIVKQYKAWQDVIKQNGAREVKNQDAQA